MCIYYLKEISGNIMHSHRITVVKGNMHTEPTQCTQL